MASSDDISLSIVHAGDEITKSDDFMKGHNTYVNNGKIVSAVTGIVEKVSKLIRVNPMKSRYIGEVGDIVVGRVRMIGNKRWTIDIGSRLDAVLPLVSINLPGGELRRKNEDDEAKMRQYLSENDLIVAEIHSIHNDGVIMLHTRHLRYGKLPLGMLKIVPHYLLYRSKTQIHTLPCGGISAIFGANGWLWFGPSYVIRMDLSQLSVHRNYQPVSDEDRAVIIRLCNCVSVLQAYFIPVFNGSLIQAYETSMKYSLTEIIQNTQAVDDICHSCMVYLNTVAT